jgi:hypothetical protein
VGSSYKLLQQLGSVVGGCTRTPPHEVKWVQVQAAAKVIEYEEDGVDGVAATSAAQFVLVDVVV